MGGYEFIVGVSVFVKRRTPARQRVWSVIETQFHVLREEEAECRCSHCTGLSRHYVLRRVSVQLVCTYPSGD